MPPARAQVLLIPTEFMLVPRARDPCGQQHGSRLLAGTEAGSPGITDFWPLCAASEIRNNKNHRLQKMGSYCACALLWLLPEVSIRGAGQKNRSSGDENERNSDAEGKNLYGGQRRRIRLSFCLGNSRIDRILHFIMFLRFLLLRKT